MLPTEGSTAQDFGYAVYIFDVVYADLVFPQDIIISSFNEGPDGILGNEDDEVDGITLQTYKDFYSNNWEKFYNNPGPDQIWLTSDDEAGGWWWCRFDTGGSMQVGPGSDGIWFSTDDEIRSWNDWSDPAIERSYGDPGLDNIWETSDDVITVNWYGAYMTREYEGSYNHWDSWTRMVSYVGPGPDEAWFTADDEVQRWSTQEFDDGTKFYTRRNTYYDAGPDATMFTEDDVLGSYATAENSY